MTTIFYALGSLLRACGLLDDSRDDHHKVILRWLVFAGTAVKAGATALQAIQARTRRPQATVGPAAKGKLFTELRKLDEFGNRTDFEEYRPQ